MTINPPIERADLRDQEDPRDSSTVNLRSQEHEQFYREFTLSASAFISSETQHSLRRASIVIAGLGSVGNPIATSLIRNGAENLTILDPDTVELSNLPKQNYSQCDIGKNKAVATTQNLLAINPYAQVTTYPEGVTEDNVESVVQEADVVVDAIDITALDRIWDLHVSAQKFRKPVIVGYDLAGTAMIAVYRYDQKTKKPLDGALDQRKIQQFRVLREQELAGKITRAQLLNFIYDTFTGPINPLHVPVEQLKELRDRKIDDTRSYQIGTTSTILGALSVETIKAILNGERTKKVIHVDAPSLVRKSNPGLISRVLLTIDALRKMKERSSALKI